MTSSKSTDASTEFSAPEPQFTLAVKDEDEYTLLTVREIAERFSMSILNVRKLVNSGKLPKVTPLDGSPIRVSVAALKRFINEHTVIMTPRRVYG